MNQMGLENNLKIALGITDEEELKKLIKVAGNGKKAVEICSVEIPDLIFMDINMPIMGGFEASKLIK